MEREMFGPVAMDALGEIMNISLGSSATAISNMLDHRVSITTPQVSVVNVKDITLDNIDPAVGVEIKYVEGLSGSNIMLLKRHDIKVIVDILMGMETPDEEFELNELTISCVCEVMNQMMGSAATAMSDFLGYRVDISTPESFELDNVEQFRAEHVPQGADQVVMVRFRLKIEDALESKFINVMSLELARELLKGQGMGTDQIESSEPVGVASSPAPAPAAAPAPAEVPSPAPAASSGGGGGRKLTQEEIEALIAGNAGGESAPAPAPPPAPAPSSGGGGGRKLTQEEIEALIAGNAAGESAPAPAPAPAPEPSGGSNRKLTQEEIEKMVSGMNNQPAAAPAPAAQMPQGGPVPPYPMPGADGQMQGGYMGYPPMFYPPYPYPYPPQPEPKMINSKPLAMEPLDVTERLGKEQAQNLDLIMEVPLQVTVEIGRARRKVQDILEFAKGSLVVLDKLAGDSVDLFVNGKCIARGEVVVIEDNFGVRITEIVQPPSIEALAKK